MSANGLPNRRICFSIPNTEVYPITDRSRCAPMTILTSPISSIRFTMHSSSLDSSQVKLDVGTAHMNPLMSAGAHLAFLSGQELWAREVLGVLSL
jgi:hypothetical protein